jgi:MFS transporter, MHS family, proline/betaine transporter
MMTSTHKKVPIFRLISAASIGTILEWYDFSLFAYLTPVLAKLFFPQQNGLVALMQTYAIFAVGFFVRPLGAMLFGHYGDRQGRQKLLILSIILMSLSTFCMGLLPDYAHAGLLAPILLILLRLFQGLSVGGESTGATLFVLESVSSKYRGFMGGLLWGMIGVGMLLGSLAATIAAHSEVSWAWRVPFLLGIFTGIIGYFLRKQTTESYMFLEVLHDRAIKKFPLREGLVTYKKASLTMIAMYMLSAVITYLIFVFMPGYATNIVGLPLSLTTTVSTVAFLGVTLLVPLGGYLSDIIGRKKCLIASAAGFVLLSYPLFFMISKANLVHFEIAQGLFLLLAAVFQGAITAAAFEMVPTVVRYSVIAVCYNISYSLFGGTAPFVATYLVSITGHKSAPGLYLTLIAVITWCVIFLAYDRHQMDAIK